MNLLYLNMIRVYCSNASNARCKHSENSYVNRLTWFIRHSTVDWCRKLIVTCQALQPTFYLSVNSVVAQTSQRRLHGRCRRLVHVRLLWSSTAHQCIVVDGSTVGRRLLSLTQHPLPKDLSPNENAESHTKVASCRYCYESQFIDQCRLKTCACR